MEGSSARRALICGISGQDGSYLAKLLLDKGYEVFGTSRDAQVNPFTNLRRLGVRNSVRTLSMSPTDFRSVLQGLTIARPDEVYNLSAQSSVGLSFDQPVETMESISLGTLNILETIRFANNSIHFYNAGSSESFGDTGPIAADENTPFRPKSPYAVAKATSVWQVASYREAYGLFACSGILFNHESPLRPERYVTRKIVAAACRIARGSKESLSLGEIGVTRDWGWAPEYVDAMHRMLQQPAAEDFVIATGYSCGLADFLVAVFKELNMDWQDHVVLNRELTRPAEIRLSAANPEKAARVLGWRAQHRMPELAAMLVREELKMQNEK